MHQTLEALAAQQEQVATRSQLAALGVGESAVRTHVRAGRWTIFGAKIVVLHNGPLTRSQREWAAVLAAGPAAALAGRTALSLAGLKRWGDDAVHVLAPRGCSPSKPAGLGIVIHETRVPADGGLAVVGLPPRTPVDRAAIDAASWTPTARSACGLLAAVVQQRLSTGPRLLEALEVAGRIRHRRVMKLVLQDISGGAEALSEIDFTRLVRRERLGKVIHQAERLDGSGRKRYLDAIIEAPSGACIACEADGGVHLVASTYWEDMARGNELVIMGEAGLRFPTLAMRTDEPLVVDQIRRALAARERAMKRLAS